MELKKVCILTSVHPSCDVRIFHKEAKSLAKVGYDVTLIAQHDREEIVDGVKIINLQKPRNRIERATRTIWSVFWKALKNNADVYHLHDPELIPIGLLLKLRGKKIIYDMHENLPKQIKNKRWIHPKLRQVLSSVAHLTERLLLSGTPVIFAEDSYRKDYLWVKKYVTVLNMPFITQLLPFKCDPSVKHVFAIGYMGGVGTERGSLAIIEALKILKERGHEPRFECVGPAIQSHKEQLLKKCDKNGLHNIIFHGYLPAYKGWQIIGRCSVGLALLQPIPNYIESYPTKIFEYMAMGMPVIASNFPLYRSIIDGNDCGLCVDPLDSQAIADALAFLIMNPARAYRMGNNGHQAVLNKYNWPTEELKLLKFYETVL